MDEFFSEGFYHLCVFSVGEIHFARIHLESAAVIRSIHVFGRQMEMQVAQFVRLSAVIDLLGLEEFLHSARHIGYIRHERIALLIGQLVEVVHMLVISH